MSIIVQKYGGSSVADAAQIKQVAGRIAAARDKGHRVVVVVSAMGDTTDELIKLAYQVAEIEGSGIQPGEDETLQQDGIIKHHDEASWTTR